jgi:protein TonB
MFAESLLESAGVGRTNQRWTMLFSLSLEGLVIGFLVLLPLLENQALPRVLWTVTTPVAPPRLGVAHPGPAGGGSRHPRIINPVVALPSSIPRGIDLTPDDPGPGSDGPDSNVPPGVPWGVPNSIGPVLPTSSALPSLPQAPVSPRISIASEANVVYRVLPTYPPIARQIGAQGPVVLHAVISRDGTVESLSVVSSAHPTLNQAALAAVAQWRFRPYLLNGGPVEVEAQITVNFVIAR